MKDNWSCFPDDAEEGLETINIAEVATSRRDLQQRGRTRRTYYFTCCFLERAANSMTEAYWRGTQEHETTPVVGCDDVNKLRSRRWRYRCSAVALHALKDKEELRELRDLTVQIKCLVMRVCLIGSFGEWRVSRVCQFCSGLLFEPALRFASFTTTRCIHGPTLPGL